MVSRHSQTPQPLSLITPAQGAEIKARIKLIATDMDGTITHNGKFSPLLWESLTTLAAVGIKVILTTGRSAGWVQGIFHYLPAIPMVGAIAENGGLYYPSSLAHPQFLSPIGDLQTHRHNLATTFQHLRQQFPQLAESSDNLFRLSDWTFDVAGLSLQELTTLETLCHQQGWGFTYSNVQCHIKPQGQGKARGLQQVLAQYFPELQPDQILTMGDSINDESMFNPEEFPLSIGVANIHHYLSQLKYQPKYITAHPEIAGFAELVDFLKNS
ncbi:MAG: HAD family phosphatase [Coleofasciculaceae cyanobacterium SM2_1_6]|nr:HAD family phosphatase [Coleofasciculaceae cyanobacterium SM2_1_6]